MRGSMSDDRCIDDDRGSPPQNQGRIIAITFAEVMNADGLPCRLAGSLQTHAELDQRPGDALRVVAFIVTDAAGKGLAVGC